MTQVSDDLFNICDRAPVLRRTLFMVGCDGKPTLWLRRDIKRHACALALGLSLTPNYLAYITYGRTEPHVPQNAYDKIWDAHDPRTKPTTGTCLFTIDRHLRPRRTSPQAPLKACGMTAPHRGAAPTQTIAVPESQRADPLDRGQRRRRDEPKDSRAFRLLALEPTPRNRACTITPCPGRCVRASSHIVWPGTGLDHCPGMTVVCERQPHGDTMARSARWPTGDRHLRGRNTCWRRKTHDPEKVKNIEVGTPASLPPVVMTAKDVTMTVIGETARRGWHRLCLSNIAAKRSR